MTDQVTERMVVRASPERCWEVAIDFERYPEWARDLKEATVLERDAQGRGVEVRFRAAGMGYSTSYTLRYDHSVDGVLAWRLTRGDLTRKLDGSYRFEESPDGGVDVTYQLEAELVVPLPGFIKRRTQLKIMHTALKELKSRVEAQSAP